MLWIGRETLASVAEAVDGVVTGGGEGLHPAAVSTDTRSITEGALFVALIGERFDAHDFVAQAADAGAAAAIVSRPVDAPIPTIRVDDTLVALQRLGHHLWSRATEAGLHTVALTGSNGKTTTKEMLAALWGTQGTVHATRGNLNNHIGVPLTLCALPVAAEHAIVEMGANDFGDISELIEMAPGQERLITSIGHAHLERLGSLDGVRRVKAEIFEGADASTTAIVPVEERERLGLDDFPGAVLTVGAVGEVARGADVDVELVGPSGGGNRVRLSGAWGEVTVDVPLPGPHNARNLATAFATLVARGIAPTGERGARSIAPAIAAMQLPGGRWRIERRGEWTFVDDAYNANPSSVRASYEAFLELPAGDERRVAILGEMRELGERAEELHRQTAVWLAQRGGVDLLIFVGVHAEAMSDAARCLELGIDAAACTCVEEAAEVLRRGGPATLYLKASRGARLERLVDALGVS